MVPLVYLLLVIEYAGRKIVGLSFPVARTGPAPGGPVTWILMALILLGFICSIRHPRTR
jgi:TRAP-type mannitol/chloroaromatic compound transport system permease small subunit